jgi:glycine betaine/proline transport system substrate-binding protein
MLDLPRWSRGALVAAALLVPGLGHAADLPGKGITVRPIAGNDAESLFQLEVVNIALEKLGYGVVRAEQVPLAIYYQSVADGERDFGAETWWLEAQPLYNKAGGPAKATVIGPLIDNATQGYLIDKATAERYHISKLEQLADPKIAALFSADGQGKALLNGCPPGWPCERVIDYQIKAYGLTATVTHTKGDPTVLKADVVSRFKNGQSVLYYSWQPYWLNQVLIPGNDVVWLDVDTVKLPNDQKDHKTVTQHGWEVSSIRIDANNDFLAKNPAARKLFELAKIPLADVERENLLLIKGEKSRDDIRRHAEDWVRQNQAVVDGWVAQVLAATSKS